MLSGPVVESGLHMRTFFLLSTCHLVPLLALTLAVGCGADPADSASPGGADGTTTDGSTADGTDGTDGTSGPSAALAASVEDHPLVAWVTLESTTSGPVELRASAPDAPERVLPGVSLEAGTATTVPLLGLRAETTYDLTLTDSAGSVATTELTTGPLPEDLPPVTVDVLLEDRVNPGFIVFPLSRWDNGPVAGWGYAVALDEGGQVAWFVEIPLSSTFRWTESGSMLLTDLTAEAIEVNGLGEQENSLDVPSTGLDTVHHELDLVAGADGGDRLLFLSSELRQIGGYTDDETGEPVTHNVVADVLVEASWDGTIGRTVNLFDLLDPLRTTASFDYPFWNIPPYSGVSDPKDWTHGNALLEGTDGAWTVSLRNQDWILKVDPETGTLMWTLGWEGDFSLQDGRWFSTQHSPVWIDETTLLLYDNGTNRPGEDSPSTRVVAYRIDEAARTATQLWEYTGEAPYYAPASGGVEPLEDGYLIADGGVVDAVTIVEGVIVPHLSPRMVEVEGSDGSFEPVLSVRVGYWGDMTAPGYLAYRAEKVADLYGSRGVLAYAR